MISSSHNYHKLKYRNNDFLLNFLSVLDLSESHGFLLLRNNNPRFQNLFLYVIDLYFFSAPFILVPLSCVLLKGV